MSGVLAYRRALDRELSFAAATWSDNYRDMHAAGLVSMEDWDAIMPGQLRKILTRPGVELWVAYHPHEEDPKADVYGWIAVEHEFSLPHRVRKMVDGRLRWSDEMAPAGCPLVHFVYVKQAYRRQGIARGLFQSARVSPVDRFIYTSKVPLLSSEKDGSGTYVGREFVKRHAPNAQWNPLPARHPK